MTVETVIAWLGAVEELAHSVYKIGAEQFASDEVFSAFLRRMAEDEASHCRHMESAAQFVGDMPRALVCDVLVDAATRERVEAPLRGARAGLERGEISKRELVATVVDAEFSEWNDIFLYVIECLCECSKTFQKIAATIQAHESRIEQFLHELPEELMPRRDVRDLPRIWEHTVLVVEDDAALRTMWERVLGCGAKVETAENGAKALEKTRSTFYDVILTDVDMPVLNGVDFARQVIEAESRARDRIIMCTGNVSPEVAAVTREFGIKLFAKPVSVSAMRDAVKEILELGV